MVRYEIKKVFGRSGGRIALLIMAALTAFTCYLAMSSSANEWVNENGDTEEGYHAMVKKREAQKAWAGFLTEERIREVIEENRRIASTPEYNSKDLQQNNIAFGWRQGIMEIRNLLNNSYATGFRELDYYRADRLTPDMAGDFYANRVRLLKEWMDDESDEAYYRYSDAEKAYLIRQYETLRTPFYWDYSRGWQNAMTYFPTLSMILIMVLGHLVSGIFSNEFQWKSDAILFASAHGRDRSILAKLAAGLLITTVIYGAAVAVYSLAVFGYLGTSGASCPVQAAGNWKCFYHLTNLQAWMLTVLGGYVGCLFIALLTMFVSAKSRSTVIGVLVPVVIIFLPNFVENMNFGTAAVDKVLSLLPDRLLQINTAMTYFDLLSFGKLVIGAVPVVIALYFILSFALPPVIYREYRRREIL